MLQRRTFRLVAVPDEFGMWTVTVERAPELRYRGRVLGRATSSLREQVATRFGLAPSDVKLTLDVRQPARV